MICLNFRTPDTNSVLVMRTPFGVFSTKGLVERQSQEHCSGGKRLISSKTLELPDVSDAGTSSFEPLSAARCRVFQRSSYKVLCSSILFYIWYEITYLPFAPCSCYFNEYCFMMILFLLYVRGVNFLNLGRINFINKGEKLLYTSSIPEKE